MILKTMRDIYALEIGDYIIWHARKGIQLGVIIERKVGKKNTKITWHKLIDTIYNFKSGETNGFNHHQVNLEFVVCHYPSNYFEKVSEDEALAMLI